MKQYKAKDIELFKAKLLLLKARDETLLEETKLQIITLGENDLQ